MITGIHHTAISTPDLARAIDFYRDLMGFDLIMQHEQPPGDCDQEELMRLPGVSYASAVLRKGHSMIELFEFAAPKPAASDPARPVCDHGITHFCFHVDDLVAEVQRLEAAGMEFHCVPKYSHGLGYIYGRDPDGNVLELIEVQDPDHTMAL